MKHAKTLPDRTPVSSDRSRDVSGALLDAFRELILKRGYHRVTVRDLIERASVARSTFYEHFDDKSDILRQSIRPLFAVLAACVAGDRCGERVAPVLEHFADNKKFADVMLRGPARELLVRFLAEEIEACFALRAKSRSNAGKLLLSRSLAAVHIAGAQLALIEAWLQEPHPSKSDAIAHALFETSNAMAHALLRD